MVKKKNNNLNKTSKILIAVGVLLLFNLVISFTILSKVGGTAQVVGKAFYDQLTMLKDQDFFLEAQPTLKDNFEDTRIALEDTSLGQEKKCTTKDDPMCGYNHYCDVSTGKCKSDCSWRFDSACTKIDKVCISGECKDINSKPTIGEYCRKDQDCDWTEQCSGSRFYGGGGEKPSIINPHPSDVGRCRFKCNIRDTRAECPPGQMCVIDYPRNTDASVCK